MQHEVLQILSFFFFLNREISHQFPKLFFSDNYKNIKRNSSASIISLPREDTRSKPQKLFVKYNTVGAAVLVITEFVCLFCHTFSHDIWMILRNLILSRRDYQRHFKWHKKKSLVKLSFLHHSFHTAIKGNTKLLEKVKS